MQITIEYESSWRNSFLDGSNNEALPKHGRKYIGSGQELKKPDNFKQRSVTLDTVMGLLNRLIGDQQKLYQARGNSAYFFKEIEGLVSWDDNAESWDELVYLRNMSGSFDQNSFTGSIRMNHPSLTSDSSQEFWGILGLNFEELCKFVIADITVVGKVELDPLSICDKFEEIAKYKPIENMGVVLKAVETLLKHFPETNYFNPKGLVNPINVYCSMLYLQLERMKHKGHDMDMFVEKSGAIKGVSKRLFTKKDFMDRYTTGSKKRVFGNPYIIKQFIKGEGQVTSMLTKARGTLEITLDVDKAKGHELVDLIECAGVSSFYLGKKGLAYVTSIRP
jgi:hypothetical protein